VVNSTVHIQVDAPEGVSEDLLQQVALAEVRSFAETFNSESTVGRMVLVYPIQANGTMTIILQGVPKQMEPEEFDVFRDIVEKVILGVLTSNVVPVEFELQAVTLLFQESSSGLRRMLRRGLQSNNDDSFNKVHLAVSTVCGNAEICTDEALQSLLDQEGPALAPILKEYLVVEPASSQVYFQEVDDILIGPDQSSIPELPPLTEFGDPETGSNSSGNDKQAFPKWLGFLLFFSLILAATAVFFHMRRQKQKAGSGQKFKDHAEYDQNGEPLDEDSEYSERHGQFDNHEEIQQSAFMVNQAGDEDDQGSLGDEFSLDGGEISVGAENFDPYDEDEDEEPAGASGASTSGTNYAGESFPAPRRTRQVNRGRSKRVGINR